MFDITPIEGIYVFINTVGVLYSFFALFDSIRARSAVASLNGHAREIAASNKVRNETLRLGCQLILLGIALPALILPGDTPLNYLVVALMAISLFLLHASALDRRDRKELLRITLEQLEAERIASKVTVLERIESKLDENTKVSQAAREHADAAYKEANNVNVKIADLNTALLAHSDEVQEGQNNG